MMKIIKNKKTLLILALIVLVVIAIIITLEKTRVINFFRATESNSTIPTKEKVDYGGPSKEEQNAGNEAKENISESQPTQDSPDPATGKTSITPTITIADVYNGNLEVAAFVSIVEQGGSCIINLTKDGKTTPATVAASPNAQTTSCQSYSTPISTLQKGTYTITVTYSSAKYYGTSEPRTVTIQ